MTAEDVAGFRLGFDAWLERAVLLASGMTDRDDSEDEDDDVFAKPEEYEAPEHSLMASGADPSPTQDLSEYRESDTIHALTDLGYTIEEIDRLLIPELDTVIEGAQRAREREQRKRKKQERKANRG